MFERKMNRKMENTLLHRILQKLELTLIRCRVREVKDNAIHTINNKNEERFFPGNKLEQSVY